VGGGECGDCDGGGVFGAYKKINLEKVYFFMSARSSSTFVYHIDFNIFLNSSSVFTFFFNSIN
jgi:hypothetical protein